MTESNHDLVIIELDRARQALAKAQTIQQTMNILNTAHAAEIYAKRQHLSEDAIAYAHAIKFEALRQLGGLLKDMPKNAGTRLAGRAIGGSVKELPKDPTPTLADLGIDKKTSMIAHQLADLPPVVFAQVRDGRVAFTKALQEIRRGANTKKAAWSPDSAEQRLLAAISCEIEWAPPGSQPLITEILRCLTEKLDDAWQSELRAAVAIAKDELAVHDAEPGGFRIFEDEHQAATHPGAPHVVASCKSTYMPWVKELTTAQDGIPAVRRKQIDRRLNDMEKGKLPTKTTERTHFAVAWAIKDLTRTSPLRRGWP